MARFEYVEWLVTWLFSRNDLVFDWDDGNEHKIAQKHGVEVGSAEQVFRNEDVLVPLGIQVAPTADEPRFGVLGCDSSGRLLAISFTVRGGKIRVISARAMSRSERKKYAALRKE